MEELDEEEGEEKEEKCHTPIIDEQANDGDEQPLSIHNGAFTIPKISSGSRPYQSETELRIAQLRNLFDA